jgi:uncharacterized protein (TIGR00369 family)
MNDVATFAAEIASTVPEGFKAIPLNGFAGASGPLYGKLESDRLILGFRVELRHCNPANICHGGMLMTFADMLLGMGSNVQAKLGRFLPTVNMTSDFLAPAPLGCWVEGRTEVLRTTRNLVFAQCLVTADGAPAMRASGILKLGQPFEASSVFAKLFT